MKRLLLIGAVLTSTAFAQQTFYTDQNGQPLGAAIEQGNMTFYTDSQGRPIGTAIGGQPPPSMPAYEQRRPPVQDYSYSTPDYSISTPSPYSPDSTVQEQRRRQR